MAIAVEPLVTQLRAGDGELVAGDISLLLAKTLVQNGVGFVLRGAVDDFGSLLERMIDSVLPDYGLAVRSISDRERMLQAVGQLWGTTLARGVVLVDEFGTDADLLHRLSEARPRAAVVALSSSSHLLDAVESAVIEPEWSPDGLSRAIDEAFEIAALTRRVCFVVVRPELSAVKGTMSCRDNVLPKDALAHFAHPAVGIDAVDAVRIATGVGSTGESRDVIVCSRPCLGASVHVLSLLAATGLCRADELPDVIELATPGLPGVVSERLAQRGAVLVLAEVSDGLRGRLDATLSNAGVESVIVHGHDRQRELQSEVAAAILHWLVTQCELEALADLDPATLFQSATLPEHVLARMPSRHGEPARRFPTGFVNGLVLAQARIGMPLPVDSAGVSYRLRSGQTMSVLDAETVLRCPDLAAASTVLVVYADTTAVGAVSEALANRGQPELVDTHDALALARAVVRATSAGTAAVVIATAMQHAETSSAAVGGFEEPLRAADHIGTACLALERQQLELSSRALDLGPVVTGSHGAISAATTRRGAQMGFGWYLVSSMRSSRINRLRRGTSARLSRLVLRTES